MFEIILESVIIEIVRNIIGHTQTEETFSRKNLFVVKGTAAHGEEKKDKGAKENERNKDLPAMRCAQRGLEFTGNGRVIRLL
ncbi:MAG TPA: hypothetical protein H9851_01830 [Candidatus Borkfalkia faecavium]|uniref:Uncharacterized protein n=1 Tax=Candidatus Borkfalkia faecavium TaxID=2838508 RepID=A0A9D1W066_9FIRM|nr:hypothetical protein [Candidatus Borkfalkia faecavium]